MREQIKSKENKKIIGPGPILIFGVIFLLILGGVVYYSSYRSKLSKQGFSCVNDAECDDGNLCTMDECSTRTGICYNPKKKCPSGESCNLDIGECEIITEQEDAGEIEDTQQESTSQQESEEEQEEQEEQELIPLSSTDQVEDAIREALGL